MERQPRQPQARIPSATYRLQFNAGFTFADATRIVGYLHDLGVSDVYASSYLAAKEGSVHGYDVVNQTILNRELGDERSYHAFVDELARHGMGHILDFVPNHMCIESGDNIWWMDILENGMSSPYANFFDIDWAPVKKELTGKVLLPFLGDQYGKVLESGGLQLLFRDGAFFVQCNALQIPIEPRSYLQILQHRLDVLKERFPPDAAPVQELLSIETGLQHLPPATEQDPEKMGERQREKEIIKKRLWQLCQGAPEVTEFIAENVRIFNGVKGEPGSFDLMDQLLQEQVYRLSYWGVATEEINYRRFFDINALAAIRMEDQAVYHLTHGLLLRLIREGKVTGVRIDHVDGLYDPVSYLQNLQKSAYLQLCGCGQGGEGDDGPEGEYYRELEREPYYQPLYAVVEKILMKGEQLPEQWPVAGTTGYEFLNSVNGIFVDTEAAKQFDRIYDRFVKRVSDFTEIVYEKKKLVMQVSLSGEVNMLAHQLNNISEQDRLTRDFTLNSLARAISEVIACFPVYRTYANSPSVRDKDMQYIEAAVSKAKRRNPAISGSVFDFVRDVLLLKAPERAAEESRRTWLSVAMRFQQITGPVMAKGLEDTAFYVYHRLISLNDVGGMPGKFGTTLDAFHGQNLERNKNFPHGMITTSTHDSKRGEDVRTRIDALSELPELWQKSVVRWSRINKGRASLIDNQRVPDRNEEYLIYQTLLGAWPAGEIDQAGYESFRGRIKEYLIKALREAKVNTSWVSPNAAYEEAVLGFADGILEQSPGNLFLREFRSLQKRLARCGVFTSLSQALLKMTVPGVPDFYQGTELIEFTLVDPDNRRQVDYGARIVALRELRVREAEIGAQALCRELLERSEDGRIKLFLIYRVLNYRRQNRDPFDFGEYLPLEAKGARERHVCAFARKGGEGVLIVAAARLVATLMPEPESSPLGEGVWQDTVLLLPEGAAPRYRNVVNSQPVEAKRHGGRPAIPLAVLFGEVSVALLEPA
ncbi:malto-oligosyltrehalose synthase [Geomonas nitrogeniifigens]|uniref:Malto-oligosyltrehalose synthase n=1 Tax=Geomonas diazotrophica TaxID=2843197 RepID=A0ABX8JGP6_9BACT|nr:malto-oligosyltrehalose synthase [Geomonas nitrogeniifigens]QWV97503.1 malto-oligosyltrehalose synthase [Geomonas nitrogeniifigens]